MDKDEVMRTVAVPDDIICKDCAYRDDGTVWANDYRKSNCIMYKNPHVKPKEVLFNGAYCRYYEKEESE